MLSLKPKEHEMLLKRGEHIDESDLIKAPVCDGTRVLGEEQEATPHLFYK